ncbi:hypothetical protein BKA93DRAFT_746666 [Sparassis latifolia]
MSQTTTTTEQGLTVEASRAKRLERQQSRFRDRGGIFVPSTHNALLDILLARGVNGESPAKALSQTIPVEQHDPPPPAGSASRAARRKSHAVRDIDGTDDEVEVATTPKRVTAKRTTRTRAKAPTKTRAKAKPKAAVRAPPKAHAKGVDAREVKDTSGEGSSRAVEPPAHPPRKRARKVTQQDEKDEDLAEYEAKPRSTRRTTKSTTTRTTRGTAATAYNDTADILTKIRTKRPSPIPDEDAAVTSDDEPLARRRAKAAPKAKPSRKKKVEEDEMEEDGESAAKKWTAKHKGKAKAPAEVLETATAEVSDEPALVQQDGVACKPSRTRAKSVKDSTKDGKRSTRRTVDCDDADVITHPLKEKLSEARTTKSSTASRTRKTALQCSADTTHTEAPTAAQTEGVQKSRSRAPSSSKASHPTGNEPAESSDDDVPLAALLKRRAKHTKAASEHTTLQPRKQTKGDSDNSFHPTTVSEPKKVRSQDDNSEQIASGLGSRDQLVNAAGTRMAGPSHNGHTALKKRSRDDWNISEEQGDQVECERTRPAKRANVSKSTSDASWKAKLPLTRTVRVGTSSPKAQLAKQKATAKPKRWVIICLRYRLMLSYVLSI